MESKRKAALYVNQQALDRLALALFAADGTLTLERLKNFQYSKRDADDALYQRKNTAPRRVIRVFNDEADS